MEDKCFIRSVTGDISPSLIGNTITHEHIFIDANKPLYLTPPIGRDEGASKGFEVDNLGWIRYFPYSHKDNLHLNSEDLAMYEMKQYRKYAGEGATVVDVTTEGIRSLNGRKEDIISLQRISKESGVTIICGCGYYIEKSHPKEVKELTVEELSDKMVKEIKDGIDGTGIKAGVIGEIGCSWPLTDDEKKVLKASADAQKKTLAPLIIHPGRNTEAPMEIVNILRESGANLSRTVMSHLDRTFGNEVDLYKKLAETGVILELDLFGIECSYYQHNSSVDMMNDAQRILVIKELVDVGFASQIVVAHDIHTKHRTEKFGGHGFSHLIRNIVPRMFARGITQENINKIMIENPRRWLTFER